MFVEERKVGIDDGARREVAVEQFLDEQTGLLNRRELQGVVEFVVIVQGGGRGAVVNLAKIEPVVGERVDEAAGPRIVEQAVSLGSEDFGIAEPALRG
jgi:predicted RNA-binding protein with TRAM domain